MTTPTTGCNKQKSQAMLSDRRIRTSLLAIATDLTLTALKVLLAFYTGSAALRADALHSATDFIISIILLVGIALKIKNEKQQAALAQGKPSNPSPAPASWGHWVESGLAILVALIILYVPYDIIRDIGQHNTAAVQNLGVGIFGTLVVIFIVLFISRLKLYVARETNSIALEADGYHSMVDVFTSIAVLVSLLGFMVGIPLDKTVAVVIAIMIAITGIELLLSGIKSLIQKTSFNQLNLYEALGEGLKNALIKLGVFSFITNTLRKLALYRLRVIALLVALFFASGFSAVPHGSIGKRFWLASPEPGELGPGLHYALPWPLGKITPYSEAAIYTLNIGTRAKAMENGAPRLWTEIKTRQLKNETASYYLTQDEQLIDISLVVAYRIAQPAKVFNQVNSHHQLVQQLAQASLNKFVLARTLEQLLNGQRHNLSKALQHNLQSELNALLPALHIIDVQWQSFRLPAVVIAAYRDLINAQQEKQQAINNAVAERLKSLPLSRAAYTESLAQARAEALTKILQAEGNMAQIKQLSSVQRQFKAGFEFNAYLNTVSALLNNKTLLIKDAGLSNSDIKTWLPAPTKRKNK